MGPKSTLTASAVSVVGVQDARQRDGFGKSAGSGGPRVAQRSGAFGVCMLIAAVPCRAMSSSHLSVSLDD